MQSKTGKLLGPTQFRALLKENDFVYHRPNHNLTDFQGAQAGEVAEEWLADLNKGRSGPGRALLCGPKHIRVVAGSPFLLDE